MKYSNAINLKDFTYYTLIVWDNKHKTGKGVKTEYKRESNAIKKFEELVNSGFYECVMLRKEEVFLRTPDAEISCSSPMKRWEAA